MGPDLSERSLLWLFLDRVCSKPGSHDNEQQPLQRLRRRMRHQRVHADARSTTLMGFGPGDVAPSLVSTDTTTPSPFGDMSSSSRLVVILNGAAEYACSNVLTWKPCVRCCQTVVAGVRERFARSVRVDGATVAYGRRAACARGS